jgi:hypothetical protein
MNKEPDPTNPKDLIGVTKCPLRLVPPALMLECATVMKHGAEKYGPYNWRDQKIRATVYGEAILRHLLAWMDGEDVDPDSGKSHLGHIAAGCGIVIDAEHVGSLIDDRHKSPTGYVSKELKKQSSQKPPLTAKELDKTPLYQTHPFNE